MSECNCEYDTPVNIFNETRGCFNGELGVAYHFLQLRKIIVRLHGKVGRWTERGGGLYTDLIKVGKCQICKKGAYTWAGDYTRINTVCHNAVSMSCSNPYL